MHIVNLNKSYRIISYMNSDMQILYFITGNKHKFNEISNLFAKENKKYILKQIDIDTLEIQSNSILEVAITKLKSVKDQLNESCFVEDAGFFIDLPLKGFPGVYSSYVMKTIGNEGILRLIPDYKISKAHFTTAIALYFKPHDRIYTFEGSVFGKISKEIRGNQGFGFDPIFIPDDLQNKTFAELTPTEKNEFSHRGKAMHKLIEFLKNV